MALDGADKGPAHRGQPQTPRRQELESAKEILAEVFGAQPSDVEEMIRLRLEERRWHEQVDECV